MDSPWHRAGSAKAQGSAAPRGHQCLSESTCRVWHSCRLRALGAVFLPRLLRVSTSLLHRAVRVQELRAHTEEEKPSGKGCPLSYSWGALKLMEWKALEEA